MSKMFRRGALLTCAVLVALVTVPADLHAQRMRMGAMPPRQMPKVPMWMPASAMMMPASAMMMPGFPMMNHPGFAQMAGQMPLMPMAFPTLPLHALPTNPYAGMGFFPYAAMYSNPYRNTQASASSSPYSGGAGGYGAGGSGAGGYGSPGGSADSSPYDYSTPSANSVASTSMQGVSAAKFGYLDRLGVPHDGISVRWPLGLRILAPRPKAEVLRRQVDSLLRLAAAEAASGYTNTGTVSAATQATAQLRVLLKKGGSAAIAEQTDRDARQFLDRLDLALQSLAGGG